MSTVIQQSSTYSNDSKSNSERLDNLVKVAERKIQSLSNFKNKISNIRSLDTNLNNQTFILKNCYELEDSLKKEIHSSSILYDEIKDLAIKFKSLEKNYNNVENERDILLEEKKVFKLKFSDYDSELNEMRDHRKIYETELRMKAREGELLDTNVQQLANLQQNLKNENGELKNEFFKSHYKK